MATLRFGDIDHAPATLEEMESRVGCRVDGGCPSCGAAADRLDTVAEPSDGAHGVQARRVCLACRRILP